MSNALHIKWQQSRVKGERPQALQQDDMLNGDHGSFRYIDTRPNGELPYECAFSTRGPYITTMVTTPAVPATEDSPENSEKTTVREVSELTPENKGLIMNLEKEADSLRLTGNLGENEILRNC
ncbi:hypothetical protein Tco_1178019 [Tanacetum coccineum]